VTYV